MASKGSEMPTMSAENQGPLRLLSLDGGGVKGLTSLIILQQIFRELGRRVGREVQPWEFFDLIGGTSTGGYVLPNVINRRVTSIPQPHSDDAWAPSYEHRQRYYGVQGTSSPDI